MKIFRILTIIFFVSCTNFSNLTPNGGYPFLEIKTTDSSFYWYPIKNIISRQDSFRMSNYYLEILKSFNEPNISLKPLEDGIFRFHFQNRYKLLFVNLSETKITVKKWIKGPPYPKLDESLLTQTELHNYYIIKKHFPLDEKKNSKETQQYIDSLVKANPTILLPSYYRSLLAKMEIPLEEKMLYEEKHISISPATFNSLISQINKAGYWKKPLKIECKDVPSDASIFYLEANFMAKYNMVSSFVCPRDTSLYTKACQNIINAAELNKEIQLY